MLHTMEVERGIAQVRILVQAGMTGYVLTGERQYLTSYEQARRELIAQLQAMKNEEQRLLAGRQVQARRT